MSTPEWPAERVARLVIMWRDPSLTQTQIARALGVSRHAVAGKARRWNLGGKAICGKDKLRAARAALAKRVGALRAAVPVPPLPPTSARKTAGEAPLPAFHPLSWGPIVSPTQRTH